MTTDSPEGFQTEDEIEQIFEIDRPFTKETPEQSLGRVAWFGERGRAELLLTLNVLGVDVRHMPAILAVFDVKQTDFYEFTLMGLGNRSRENGRAEHPLEDAFRETVDGVTDRMNDIYGTHETENIAALSVADFCDMTDEDPLHQLQQFKQNLTAES